eukprot:jgi/Psemu1/213651/e_gw1.652.14.1
MASTVPTQAIHRFSAPNEVHGCCAVETVGCRSNHPHFLAQNLNNRAATLIAKGNYEDAISDLSTALELAKSDLSKREYQQPCRCICCSLESSLMVALERDCDGQGDHYDEAAHKRKRASFFMDFDDFDDDYDYYYDDESDMGDYEHDDDHVDVDTDASNCNDFEDNQCQEPNPSRTEEHRSLLEKHQDEGFVYYEALRVSQRSIDEGHYMGVTLPTIVLFNIAIANHLHAMSLPKRTFAEAYAAWSILQQASKLYQLAYELQTKNAVREQVDGCDGNWKGGLVSLRFMMLVTNNLGEIHRLAGNTTKQEMCLQHLWSAMIYMFYNCDRVILTRDEEEGFFYNLSPLVTPQHCAPSA